MVCTHQCVSSWSAILYPMLVLELLPLTIMDSSRLFAVQNPHMPVMPQSNIHLDILEGRDETLNVTDFFRRSFTRCVAPDSLFTADFQTSMPTLPWTYMRIWSESCGCDATSALPYALCLLSTQLDGRLHLDPTCMHSGEEAAIVQ